MNYDDTVSVFKEMAIYPGARLGIFDLVEGFFVAAMGLWESPLLLALTQAIRLPVVASRPAYLDCTNMFGMNDHPGLCTRFSAKPSSCPA